jgi:uridylate kinase
MDNELPIVVYDAITPGNLRRVLTGAQGVGTLVR